MANPSGDVVKKESNCKLEENIINKLCLKEKLEQWLDKRSILDLLCDSGVDKYEVQNQFEDFQNIPQERLLSVIRTLNYINYRKKIPSDTFIKELNDCVIRENFDKKYYFDQYGVLREKVAIITSVQKESFPIIGSLNNSIRPIAKVGFENKGAFYALAILNCILLILDKVTRYLLRGHYVLTGSNEVKLKDPEIIGKLFLTKNGQGEDQFLFNDLNYNDNNDKEKLLKRGEEFDELFENYRNIIAHNLVMYDENDYTLALLKISKLFDYLDKINGLMK